MARLILVRHGQSVANLERRFTLGPHEPLSRRGRAEAESLGRLFLERFDPVAVYASPFVRALETARLLGRVLGLEPLVVEALREQDLGELRGRSYDVLRGDPSATGVGRWRYRPAGGETLEEVAGRAGPALDALAVRHVGEEIVVVSHGGVMAALRAWASGGFDRPPVATANGSGYALVWRSAGYAGPFPLDGFEPSGSL